MEKFQLIQTEFYFHSSFDALLKLPVHTPSVSVLKVYIINNITKSSIVIFNFIGFKTFDVDSFNKELRASMNTH
jgi:hypothetical protein